MKFGLSELFGNPSLVKMFEALAVVCNQKHIIDQSDVKINSVKSNVCFPQSKILDVEFKDFWIAIFFTFPYKGWMPERDMPFDVINEVLIANAEMSG